MPIQLENGVQLTVIPTQKYKTIRIFIRFTARHTATDAVKRTLLTSLLETNSLHYPTQTALSRKLAELYGASFGLNVSKKGNLHQVNVGMNLVNGKYIEDDQLLVQGFDFLKEVLFYPNMQENQFDAATFELEKNNLIAYLNSIQEDKQTLASLSLQELYFSADSDQVVPSFGRTEDLRGVTAADLAEVYHKMMAEDQVDIFVVGDVTEADVLAGVKQLPFAGADRVHPEIFYTQPVENIIQERVLRQPVTQAKLNLAYQTGVYYDQAARFPLMVFNGLFGGFPHSKLFLNVREKESLAYYASSTVDTFRGFLSVQTGIDSTNREKVMKLVAQQLQSLQRGEITEAELNQTKAMLKNQYLLSLDNPQAQIETTYLNQWLPETRLEDDQFIEHLEAVTLAEVQKVAKQVELQAVFFLDREQD